MIATIHEVLTHENGDTDPNQQRICFSLEADDDSVCLYDEISLPHADYLIEYQAVGGAYGQMLNVFISTDLTNADEVAALTGKIFTD